MPDARLARTRATLPDGYRFGDGAADYFQWHEVSTTIELADHGGPCCICGQPDHSFCSVVKDERDLTPRRVDA